MTKDEFKALPIGVFDSGVGGLSVLKVLQEQFPTEEFVYIGDNANNPVGNRPTEEIVDIACVIAEALERMPVKLIVVACNTFTVVALDELRKHVKCPVIGVSQGVKSAVLKQSTGMIGIMATAATINTHIHKYVALEMDHQLSVWEQPCPALAGLIEQGHLDDEVLHETLNEYIQPILEQDIDVVVLGCTHFPFVQPMMEGISGKSIYYVDPAYETADFVRHVLDRDDLHNYCGSGKIDLYFTKDTALAERLCCQFTEPQKITLQTITL